MASGSDGPDAEVRTVFVSYASADEAWAEWIAWQLRAAGWQVDVQAWHSVPGTNVVAWMDDCLARADHVLLVLSAAFLRSTWAGAEWQARYEPGERVVVPVRVEACEPPGLLRPLVRVDLFDVDEHDARRALLRGLRGARDGHLVPAEQPPFPPAVGGTGTPPPDFPGLDPPAAFLTWVRDACADRYPGASVRPMAAVTARIGRRTVPLVHLEVEGERDGERGVWPVGLCPGRPDRDMVDAFHRLVHLRYEARDTYLESDLVYGAGFAEPELRRWARRTRGIRLRSLAEFEGRWDPRGYLMRQSRRLAADPSYPPELYVPQRYVLLDDVPADRPAADVFTAMVDWLDVESARLLLVLGEFGHGKSFLLRELARRLPAELPKVVPMLVELRALEKSHHVDDLLALHLSKVGEPDAKVPAVRRMLDRGRVVLLFDGFDELAQRVTFDRAAEHLRMILDAVSGRAKVVLTSRTQHFASDDQWRTAFGERVSQLAGSRLIRLADFDEPQIREFLIRLFTLADATAADDVAAQAVRRRQAERRADARLRLIHDIRDLLGLSANPRMLSFIAELPEADLLAARSADGTISSADLYAALIERWLRFEAARRRPTPGSHQSLNETQLRTAVDALAVALWDSGGDAIALGELTETVQDALTDLSAARLSVAEAAFAVGSGSLLRRGDDDRFCFAHRSVMEYLVAVAAAAQLAAGGDDAGALLERREMSELMVDFLAGSADRALLQAWARAALTRYDQLLEEGEHFGIDWERPIVRRAMHPVQAGRDNALALSRRLGFRLGTLQLVDQDLRRRDLSGEDLRYADLTRANLSGLRLHDVDLTGADLTDADLRGAWLVRPRLTAARLAGSRWDRAVLIDPVLDEDARDADELAPAVLSGRDRPRPVLRPVGAVGTTAVFSPDESLLAVATGPAVLIFDVADLGVLSVLQHPARVRSMAFTAADRLVTVGADGEVRTWDVPTGTAGAHWTMESAAHRAVTLAADGSLLAAAGADHRLRVWEVATGRRRAEWAIAPGMAEGLAFALSGALLVSRDADGWTRIWQVASGRLAAELFAHAGSDHAGAVLDGGRRMATAWLDGWLRLWDTAADRMVAEQQVEPAGCTAVAFSTDGMLATVGSGTVRLWPPPMRRRPTGGTSKPLVERAVAEWEAAPDSRPVFSPSGTLLAVVNDLGYLGVHHVLSGQRRAVSHDHVATAHDYSAHFSATGTMIVTSRNLGGTGRELAAHHLGTGQMIIPHPLGTFGLDVAGGPHSDSAKMDALASWRPDLGPRAPLAVLSEDGRTVAVADNSYKSWVRILRILPPGWARRPLPRGHPLPDVLAAAGMGHVVAFFPNRGVLALGGLRPLSLVRSTSIEYVLGSEGAVPTLGGGAVRSLAFAPSGEQVACLEDNLLRLWQREEQHWRSGSMVIGDPAAASFSRTGWLVAAGGDGVGVWVAETAEALTIEPLPEGSVAALAFSPDGRLLAAGGQRNGQGRLWIWDVSSGRLAAELVCACGPVIDVVFAADGRTIAVAGVDRTIRYWDVRSRTPVATAVLFDGGGHAILLPDGSHQVVGRPEGALWWTAKRRRFGPGELDGLVPDGLRLDPDQPLAALAGFGTPATEDEPAAEPPRRRRFGRRRP